jgi:hypothetical protein
MARLDKDTLNQLSKDQLIYLIENFQSSQFKIGEVLVDESKQHIDSDEAINRIRNHMYNVPSHYRINEFKAFLDLKLGKITYDEYTKRLDFIEYDELNIPLNGSSMFSHEVVISEEDKDDALYHIKKVNEILNNYRYQCGDGTIETNMSRAKTSSKNAQEWIKSLYIK